MSSLLVIFLFLYFFLLSSISAKNREYKWIVEYMHWCPDGVDGVVMSINGQFPGPTIRAIAGDTIFVHLTNNLPTEGVVIHWHGISQSGTPWADGAALISQCPINPGETFLYKFKVDKAGTYFYHGHYGMQRSAGLYGSLIVELPKDEKEAFHYDGEFNLLLSDWWHKSSHDQQIDLSSKPFRWIGEPQSLLMNGRGQFNCSLAAQFSKLPVPRCKLRGDEQYAPQILNVHPNKTYRLRVASTTSLSSLNLAIGENQKETELKWIYHGPGTERRDQKSKNAEKSEALCLVRRARSRKSEAELRRSARRSARRPALKKNQRNTETAFWRSAWRIAPGPKFREEDQALQLALHAKIRIQRTIPGAIPGAPRQVHPVI